MTPRQTILRLVRHCSAALTAAIVVAVFPGCRSEQQQTAPEPKPQVIIPEKPEPRDEKVEWVTRKPGWPDTLRFTADESGEIHQDDFLLRLYVVPMKMLHAADKVPEQPLWSRIDMTIRPVPDWKPAMTLRMDSVVYFDPVRSVRIPALPMLSSARHYDGWTVRTEFTNNAVVIVDPPLDEGQPLEPTVYFTWDDKTFIIKAKPIPVTFIRGVREPGTPTPRWVPDSIKRSSDGT